MLVAESTYQALIERAIECSATAAKIINVSDIVVAQWVRHKCQFGCPHYGNNFMCPPYAPSPRETVDVLSGYQRAILVKFSDRHIGGQGDGIGQAFVHSKLYELERRFFLDGHYKAISYTFGRCTLCQKCPAEKLENPSLFDKKNCLNQKMARPSMEASGIDVFQTVRNATWDLGVVQDKSEGFTAFGLVLLE